MKKRESQSARKRLVQGHSSNYWYMDLRWIPLPPPKNTKTNNMKLKICSSLAIGGRAAMIVGVFLFAIVSPAQPEDSNRYKVIKSSRVGGEGGFDYLSTDVEARRLYIPRSGAEGRLTVWD